MYCHSVFRCSGHNHELTNNKLIREIVLNYVNEAEFRELFTMTALEKIETVTSSAIKATSSAMKASLDARNAINDLTIQTMDTVNDIINNAVIEGGVLADTFVVVDGSLTQSTLNKGLESIADLSNIINPKDGLRVYVKSFYPGKGKGGGFFTFKSNVPRDQADGCLVVDPNTLGLYDGTSATLDELLVAQGTGTGSGCWVKDEEDYHCPYAFGYDNDFFTGLLSVYAIVTYSKKKGHGHLKIPEGQDFYLGSNAKNPNKLTPKLYEFGDNFSWYIPNNTRMIINGHVPIWHQPNGYGHSGGTKNFKLYGGGIIEGNSLIYSDYCFFSMNFIHTTGIKCYDITFINAINGHVFDLMGCKDIHIKGCKFIGSTMNFQLDRNGNEVIQISSATSGGRADVDNRYNRFIDLVPTSNVVIEDCEFRACRDEATGEIITYSQKAIGDHSFALDSLDKLVLKNLYIEQTDPNAKLSKLNNCMLVIPNVIDLYMDNIYMKLLGDQSSASKTVPQIAILIAYGSKYSKSIDQPTEPTKYPSAASFTRPETHYLGNHIIKNLTVDARDVPDIEYGRIIVTRRSLYLENFKYYGNTSEGVGMGADVIAFSRQDAGNYYGGSLGIVENPSLTIKNSEIINGKSIMHGPSDCTIHLENVYAEGGQWSFKSVVKFPRKLTMINVTHAPSKYGRQMDDVISANDLNIVNTVLMHNLYNGTSINTATYNPSGFCINSSFYNNTCYAAWNKLSNRHQFKAHGFTDPSKDVSE